MKKIFSMILAIAMIATLALSVSAFRNNIGNHTENEDFDIPKAQTAPVIDGFITNDNEWAGALVRELSRDNVTDGVHGFHTSFEGAVIYYMWNEAGIYIYADVSDSTFPYKQAYDDCTDTNWEWILCEGVHFIVWADESLEGPEGNRGSVFHWALIPLDIEDQPRIAERMTIELNGYAYDPEGTQIASEVTPNGYTIEAFIPSELWALSSPAIEIVEGTVLPLTAIVFNRNPGPSDYSYRDSTWYDAINSNKYYLVGTPAGASADAE